MLTAGGHIGASDLAKLDDAMKRIAGEVAHALDTEDMVRRVGAEYSIDPNDDTSLTKVLNSFRKQTDPDKLRAFGTEKQKVEALNQRRQDLWDQAYDVCQHMLNLKELQNIKQADEPKSPKKEWVYDFIDQVAQAALSIDPKTVAKTVILGLFTIAGADVIKDKVKDLDDVVNKIEQTFNKAMDQLSDYTTGELFTYTKTLERLNKQHQEASTALQDALGEYQQARKEMTDGNNSREAAIVGSMDSAVKSSLGTMLAAAKDMTGTPLLNTDLTKLLNPLGKYGGKSPDGSMVFYDSGNVRKGFNVSGTVKQGRIEEMGAAMPDALEKLEALNTAIARLQEWQKLLDHALKI